MICLRDFFIMPILILPFWQTRLSSSISGQNPIGEGNNQAGGRQTRGDHCCCVSTSQRCPVPSNGDGSGGIDPRLNLNQTRSRRQAEALEDFEIGTRIVNNVSLPLHKPTSHLCFHFSAFMIVQVYWPWCQKGFLRMFLPFLIAAPQWRVGV